jgi:hypothetical protein
LWRFDRLIVGEPTGKQTLPVPNPEVAVFLWELHRPEGIAGRVLESNLEGDTGQHGTIAKKVIVVRYPDGPQIRGGNCVVQGVGELGRCGQRTAFG